MDKKRKSYILNCEISSIENVKLGGYRQKIAIEGRAKNLPAVICLHGGPGLPMPFSVGCRGLFPDLTDRFIMVYWDQPGCGINNRKLDDSFTIERFADMTVDLVKEIRSRFPRNKLCLFGMSWGSILALHAAVRVPDLIDGAAAYGQVVTAPMISDSAFDAVERSSAPAGQKNFVRNLRAKRPDLSLKELMVLSRVIRKHTDGYSSRAAKSAPLGGILRGMLTGPDYGWKDFIAVFRNGYAKADHLVREMAAVDFRGAFRDLAVPYHIFQGEKDIVTATSDVTGLLGGLHNGNVTCTVLPNMGHFPSEAAIQEIFGEIYQFVNARK